MQRRKIYRIDFATYTVFFPTRMPDVNYSTNFSYTIVYRVGLVYRKRKNLNIYSIVVISIENNVNLQLIGSLELLSPYILHLLLPVLLLPA